MKFKLFAKTITSSVTSERSWTTGESSAHSSFYTVQPYYLYDAEDRNRACAVPDFQRNEQWPAYARSYIASRCTNSDGGKLGIGKGELEE